MPISFAIDLKDLSGAEFDERDYVVMGGAYDTQNSLGRLCEEQNDERDLAERLRAADLRNVYTQAPVLVSHGEFQKEYVIDLFADHAPHMDQLPPHPHPFRNPRQRVRIMILP